MWVRSSSPECLLNPRCRVRADELAVASIRIRGAFEGVEVSIQLAQLLGQVAPVDPVGTLVGIDGIGTAQQLHAVTE